MKRPKLPISKKCVPVINRVEAGLRARTYRIMKRVGQKELAEKLGIHPQNLSAAEGGNRPWTQEFFTDYLKHVDALAK